MKRSLLRLLGWSGGYLAVVLLERVAYAAGIADERLVEDNTRAAFAADEALAAVVIIRTEPEPFDVTDVVAAHSCVCCSSGAAVWPEQPKR